MGCKYFIVFSFVVWIKVKTEIWFVLYRYGVFREYV